MNQAEDIQPQAEQIQPQAEQIQPQAEQILQQEKDIVDQNQDNIIKEGDTIIIYESYLNQKIITVKSGTILNNKFGAFPHDFFIGKQFGSKIYSKNGQGFIFVLKPNPVLITESISHYTQILYQTDISIILLKLNIFSKSIVVESGTGSGSLSSSIANCIQDEGHLFTFEFNEERAKNAVQLFDKLGFKNVDVIWRDVLSDGFLPKPNETYKLTKCDSVFLDLPQPYIGIKHGKAVLKKGGKICCFSPCIEQVQQNCIELQSLGFIEIETIEALSRHFERKEKQFIKAFEVNEINVKRSHDEHQQQSTQQQSKLFNKFYTYSTGQPEINGHTGYLTFAQLP